MRRLRKPWQGRAWASALWALALAWPQVGLAQEVAPKDFRRGLLPGAQGQPLWVLQRPARAAPQRFRVLVMPGSGCAGMAPWAPAYFAGLLHAEVWVLHKPGVDPHDRRPAAQCSDTFVQQDALSAWQAHALAAWSALLQDAPAQPTVLVGISEGAEILPALAAALPHVAGLVLLSSSGLDPREAGALQAQRLGQSAAWRALEWSQASAAADTTVVQGRSLRYWRDLWGWALARPLIDGPWPLLQAWGDGDALVPAAAYLAFAQRAQGRAAPWCVLRLPGADHGLQRGDQDGVQRVWAWLEQWARQPQQGWCGPAAGQP